MTTTPDINALHQALATGSAQIRAALDGLRGHITDAEAEVQALEAALPPEADVLAVLDGLVDAAAAHWAAGHGGQVLAHLAPRLERDPRGALREERGPRLPDFVIRPDPGDLVGLFPELVKARLRALLATVSHDGRPQVPRAERRGRVLAAEAEVRRLEAEEEALILSARAAGVPLERRGPMQEALQERGRALRAQRDTITTQLRTADRDASDRTMKAEWRAARAEQAAVLRGQLTAVEAERRALEGIL